MAKGGFYDKDMGYDKLMAHYQAQKGDSAVFVGFLRSSGVYRGPGEPITVAQVGAIHEFGSKDGTIPERSFMRSAVDQNADKITKLNEKLASAVVDGAMDKTKALGLLGEFVKNAMKRMIQAGLKPPLKPATIRRKGSSKPLIDTGQLINSIDWEVVDPKGRK